ncbi:MAG: gliding motility-associated C-terminal domain-containing protein, partial [Saprospiraceae bacterium]|nr:gliding motility-associated C-terminal domain-containing protein [Saprospiraceae bacterium]
IELEETEELILDLGEDEVIILGDSVQLDPQTNFVVDSFVWSPQLSLGQADQLMPFSQPLENITYTLTAFNAEGCFVSDQINIIVQRPTEVYVPTAFSPDGDGSNDVFMIFAGNSVAQVRDFQIYDRWGDQMYRQGPFAPNDPQYGWDGTHRGQEMNTGVYVYFAEIEMVDGRIEMVKGDVLLLR